MCWYIGYREEMGHLWWIQLTSFHTNGLWIAESTLPSTNNLLPKIDPTAFKITCSNYPFTCFMWTCPFMRGKRLWIIDALVFSLNKGGFFFFFLTFWHLIYLLQGRISLTKTSLEQIVSGFGKGVYILLKKKKVLLKNNNLWMPFLK